MKRQRDEEEEGAGDAARAREGSAGASRGLEGSVGMDGVRDSRDGAEAAPAGSGDRSTPPPSEAAGSGRQAAPSPAEAAGVGNGDGERTGAGGDGGAVASLDAGWESDEDGGEGAAGARRPGGSAVRRGDECPYLDTISRQSLDFDFEKCCSVSLSPVNVYACLVCGKYFQGRGVGTYAYRHSLEAGHHVWMRVEDGRIWALPDGYEVRDASMRDISFLLRPSYTASEVALLDAPPPSWSRALDGSEFMPGLVGLNDIRSNSYANVVLQLLNRVQPVRDFFLLPENYEGCRSRLVQSFGQLLRKLWNPRAFKGHVSPHEFMQAVMESSDRRFVIDKPSDPVEFFAWLVNALHKDLARAARKLAAEPTGKADAIARAVPGKGSARSGGRADRSVLSACLRGEVAVADASTPASTAERAEGTEGAEGASPPPARPPPPPRASPFFQLSLDLPPAPMYRDAGERVTIPQVPIAQLLAKFDGRTQTSDARGRPHTYELRAAPDFLVLHVRRFSRNAFFIEKNPTIVTFPTKGLDLAEAGVRLAVPDGRPLVYDVVANVTHEGAATSGAFLAHVQRASEGAWYEVQDLRVTEVLPQMVALSEAYLQLYRRRG